MNCTLLIISKGNFYAHVQFAEYSFNTKKGYAKAEKILGSWNFQRDDAWNCDLYGIIVQKRLEFRCAACVHEERDLIYSRDCWLIKIVVLSFYRILSNMYSTKVGMFERICQFRGLYLMCLNISIYIVSQRIISSTLMLDCLLCLLRG
jgi:hypothetical protein